ncbi:hypothetical protein GN037_25065, partial [Escherichia coli]|nr:hypothetical protein [Escherichia coli]
MVTIVSKNQRVLLHSHHNLNIQLLKGSLNILFFLGYNRAIAKENAEVVLTINNDPLLVFGNYHNGKIACFMSDCSPHWGTQQFMSWPFYTAL